MNRALFLILPSLALLGCGGNQEEDRVIYTSFYPVYELVSRIVGDTYEVRNLTPVGAEPHDYEISNRDLLGMSSAKAIFINGLGLEPWYESLPKSMESKVNVISANIPTMEIDGVVDPHIWLNPKNAIKEMDNILSAMKEIDSQNTAIFEQNHRQNKFLFENLDNALAKRREDFGNDYFAVSHAAFGYLADRYDLQQVYVSGISPTQEPSARDMERIASKIREHNITTIFTEEIASPEIAKAIARETGAKLDTLNPLEGLSDEDMGKKNYISVMEDNFERLYQASL